MQTALKEFCQRASLSYDSITLSPNIAVKLLEAQQNTFLPLNLSPTGTDNGQTALAKNILRYMLEQGYWIARSPGMYNVVYVEGIDSTGNLNDNKIDEWNDRRIIIQIEEGGNPRIILNSQATTQPGLSFIQNPINPNGAANIAFGQYKAWGMGYLREKIPALVQRAPLRIYRDKNKNGIRDIEDFLEVGISSLYQAAFSSTKIPSNVQRQSAGDLVGRDYKQHIDFISTLKNDIRYKEESTYRFISTIINGRALFSTHLNPESILATINVDQDADGVPDYLDLCPTAFGSAKTLGCPDNDSDGIINGLDKCPDEFGREENQGCPENEITKSNGPGGQAVLFGKVRVLNSGKRALSNVQIEGRNANPTISDNSGNFRLVFVDFQQGDAVYLKIAKAGFELVNEGQIRKIVFDTTTNRFPIDIIMAPIGTIAAQAAQYYSIMKKNFNAKYKEQLKKLDKVSLNEYNRQNIAHKITIEYGNQLDIVYKLTNYLALINLDDEPELRQNAYKLFKEGNIQEAFEILNNRDTL